MVRSLKQQKANTKRLPAILATEIPRELSARPKRKYRGKHNYIYKGEYKGKHVHSQKHAEWRYKSNLYYKKNKAKVSMRMKAYYIKNKVRILERNKSYRQKNYDEDYNRIVPHYRKKKIKEQSIERDIRGVDISPKG